MAEETRKPKGWSTRTLILTCIVSIVLGAIFAEMWGGAFFVPCGTAAAAVTPVPAGAVGSPKNANGTRPAVPAGAICGNLGLGGINDVCTAPGKGCGAFWFWTCTDTYNVNTSNCSCQCM